MRDENLTTAPELSPAEAAVSYLLQRIQVDADLRWLMLGTEAFGRLCTAEAARTGENDETVERRYAAMKPGHDPRKARIPQARQLLEDISCLAAEGQQHGGRTAAIFKKIEELAEQGY